MKRIFITGSHRIRIGVSCFLVGLLTCFQVNAEELSLTASAPNAVVVGEQFRLTYTVNSQKIKDFRVPSIPDFEVLSGPNRSSMSQTSFVNGKVTSVQSITFTFILQATKEGNFSVPSATITADGKKLSSNAVTIKVLPPDNTSGNQGKSGGAAGGNSASSGQITDKEVFITASANKTKVYEQEAILLTYKIYTLVNLTELRGKMPDLKGFHTQEVELPKDKNYSLEHYNGRNYKTIVWSQYVLFPQQSGQLEIPSIPFEGIIAQPVKNYDPFDAFFNGGSSYVNVQKTLRTPKLTIDVSPLPSGKPASFYGGVGDFSISSSISTSELKANEAVTLKLVISGTGNMKLIKTPEINFPTDFEVYDPKIDNKFSLKSNGLSGNKVIEYLVIPRHAGNYTIPSVDFSFFDVKSKTYKTLSTPEYPLTVEKGTDNGTQVTSGYVNKEDLRLLGQDIRYIRMNDVKFKPHGVFFFGTLSYFLWYIVPFVLFLAFCIVYRQKAIENANVARMKTKKANKVAAKRMKTAKVLMDKGKKEEFYDEVLKAMWGYVSDKLNIPISKLSKDTIASELANCQVSQSIIEEFMVLLNDCELARYAPSLSKSSIQDIYASAIEVMSKIDNSIKK